jgi:hypothetical protein
MERESALGVWGSFLGVAPVPAMRGPPLWRWCDSSGCAGRPGSTSGCGREREGVLRRDAVGIPEGTRVSGWTMERRVVCAWM